jgi:hypothetical protein
MGVKNYRIKPNENPSPAEYNNELFDKHVSLGPSYAIGTGKRDKRFVHDQPGPG